MTTHFPNTKSEKRTEPAGARPLWLNRSMAWLLRSPLHRLVSGSILLLTFSGRKSGKVYTTPVSYTQQGEAIIIFTHSDWWKNLRGAPVTLQLRGKAVQGYAEAVAHEPATILPYLRIHLQQVTRDAHFYAVKVEANGHPNETDLVKAVQESVLIRITLTGELRKEQPYAVA